MPTEEKLAWTTFIAGVAGLLVFVAVLALQTFGGKPVGERNYSTGMIICIVIMVLPGMILRGMLQSRTEDESSGPDERDREINRRADQVRFQVLSLAGAIALSLVFTGAEHFWIATALFGGFGAAILIGAWTQLSGYRRGVPAC